MLFLADNTGFKPDSFDARDVFADEVLAGAEVALPPSYLIEGLIYEPQGSYPFCVSFAVTTMLEYLYNRDGLSRAFSQPHLFFHAGGDAKGSSFRANLDVVRKYGAIPYSVLPMPNAKVGRGKDWEARLKPVALSTPFKDAQTLTGYVKVTPDAERLKQAIMQFGPLLVGVSTKGDYYKGNAKRVSNVDNHAVLLVGWNAKGWIIFDSLWWVEKTNGYGTLDGSYTFASAYAITELPKNWEKKVEKVRTKEFENALNHYGKPANVEAEQRNAIALLDALRKFNNKSVLDAAGRFWTVYANALTYGGYTITDLLNNTYNWRRTGKHIWELDEPKPAK